MQRRSFLTRAALGGLAATTFPLGRLAFAQGKPEVSELAMPFGLDPVFAPHIVAMEKGWFREAGFTDVSTKTFAGGAIAGEVGSCPLRQRWCRQRKQRCQLRRLRVRRQ